MLVGSNGIGKTNMMEAIGYLATLSSHRVSSDGPLVRFGAEQALVRAKLVRGGQATSLELEINPGRANRGRINRTNPVRARDPWESADGPLRAGRPGTGQGRPVKPPPLPR